jgi:hypothetical protein
MTWFTETAGFFAFLRSRGWRYALMRQGQYLVSLHHAAVPPAANDNRVRA